MKGSILKRGDQTYLLRISLGKDSLANKRLYQTQTFHGTRKEAEARLRLLVSQFEQGGLTIKTDLSLNEFLAKWLETAQQKLRPRTLVDYQRLCKYYLQETLGRFPLEKLTSLVIQEAYNKMSRERNLSALTVRKVHVVLNGALKQAVRWKMLARNPASDVELPRVKRKKVIRSLTLEQALAFLEACADLRLRAYFHLALQTGARPEEILGLLWGDIDFEKGLCRIERVLVRPTGGAWHFQDPKTAGSRRSLVLDQSLLEELRRHQLAQEQEKLALGADWKGEPAFVFASTIGTPLDRVHFAKRVFKVALQRAGLDSSFRLRDLRHTCATLLLEAGENIKAVSERLGHADVRLTLNVYAHCLPAMQHNAARRAGALFGQGSKAPRLASWPSRLFGS